MNMKTLVVATANEHKVDEFKEMLAPFGYEVKSLLDFDNIEDIEETGETFAQNALIKAKTIFDAFGVPVVADDSGIEIDFYDGQPGVYSHRFMGADTPYFEKNTRIINDLEGSENRGARFVCVLAYIDAQGETHYFEGEVKGTIAHEIVGDSGFGYDPIMYYEPFQTTLGNISSEKKATISHRGRAVEKFVKYLAEEEQ